MAKKQHGGPRPGSGRPKGTGKPEHEKRKHPAFLRLTDGEHHHLLAKFNPDGVAGAIRQLIKEDMERGTHS